jgi:tetratricopeptide (TPR) repeat protein
LNGADAFSVAQPQNNAKREKELGDQYISQERFREAAVAYENALSAGRNQFTLDERVRMAVYMSWENRLENAIDELRRVLAENAHHIEARIQLARVYSWTGDLGKAITEADEVLKRSPSNQEALLVKADALEWQGRFRRAIPIYREVLGQQHRFDAQLGLSYAYLSGGNRAAANENARNLAASSVRQKNQLGELIDAIDDAGRPRVDMRYNEYQDSDHNRSERYSLLYSFGTGNQNFDLNLKRTDTYSGTEKNRSEAASFGLKSNIAEGLRFRAAAGLNRPGSGERTNLATGQFRVDAAVSNATIGAMVDTDIINDTVILIDNRIRTTNYASYVSKPWTGRFSTYGMYTYRAYSDGNHAHDAQFSPQFKVKLVPRLALGYRFRFLDFVKQSGSGFFDPSNYTSHRLFSSFSLEKKKISAYIDAFGGKQRFVRYQELSDEWIVGASAAVAFKPVSQLTIEVNGEGGNFSADSVTGFKYTILGTRVLFRF